MRRPRSMGDVSAEAFDDLEDVRGEEDGGAAGDHALKHGFESAGGDGVDTFEGLVEEEDFGAVDDGGGEGEFFLHAVGEVGDEFFCFAGEAHELEQFGGAGGSGGGVEAVHAADEAEVFSCSEAAEEGEAFGDDADLPLDFDGVGDGVEAEDLDAAGGRGEEAGEHLDGRGFAGAAGAEDGEVDVLNGGEVAETAGEARGGDGRDHVAEAYLRGQLWQEGKFRAQAKKRGKTSKEPGLESNTEGQPGLIYLKAAAILPSYVRCVSWAGLDGC